MEKYGLVVPTNTYGEYTAVERFNDWDTAERAYNECTISGKSLVQYVQIGPWSYIGEEILPRK